MQTKRNYDSTATTNSGESSSSFFEELLEDTYNEPAAKKKKFLSPKHRSQQKAPTVMDAVDKLEALSQNIRQDEFDTFGQHLASQLRGLPLTNAIICQSFINNYLSEQRLKVLTGSTTRPEPQEIYYENNFRPIDNIEHEEHVILFYPDDDEN